MKKIFMFIVLSLFLTSFIFAQLMTITSKAVEDNENDTSTDSEEKICCHIYGLGAYMKKVNSRYQLIKESECKVSENFVGGGREIVNDEYCLNQTRILTQAQIKNITKTKNRIRTYYANQSECPDNCTCTGSVAKCELENGREMTITAGQSGNVIVQVKGINMSTNVTLYKTNTTLYGVFKNNNTKEIKVLPDQVKEKIRERIRARLENQTIELDENGIYQVQGRKRARLFFLFPVRIKVQAEINSETGEVIKIRNPWWGFLARDEVEEDEE